MNRLKNIFLLIFFCFVFNSIFSQEYDFDIPEEDDSKIEFNGNLDAKWGFLNTQRSSPFYGVQFFGISEKNDYLSQYRLDFYLDGSYRHKQVGFFMKTFSQYAKEEQLSLSFFELYGTLNFSPRLSMSMGKRRFNWGKGYAFNPAGYINAEKDPENPDLALAGKTSVFFNYNRSFTSDLLRNFSFITVLLPPEAAINQKFASADKIGAAIKLYFLVKNTDIDLMTIYNQDGSFKLGVDFSTNLRENLEIHGEYSYAINEIKSIVNDMIISQYKTDGGSCLFGLRYLNRLNTTFICEYYHNNAGLSANEFSSYTNYLQNSIDSNDPDLINRTKANMSNVSRSKTLMRDYLYLKLSQPEPFSLLYTSVSVFSIFNLTDNSYLLSSQLIYKPYTNFEFILWPFFFFGKDGTDYGSKPFRKKLEVWMRFYF